jgi:histidinol-phosphatase
VPLDDDLQLALELADAADAVTLPAFRSRTLRVDTKADRTLVTEVDRGVEAMLRERIAAVRPGDAVVGEEMGATGDGARRWYLDPVDGTSNYVRGVPVFATLIALLVDGAPAVGVCSAPALGARWWGARGLGAFERGRAIRVSAVQRVEDAHFSYDDARGFDDAGIGERFHALERRCWRSRGFGDFWSHMLVAEGAVDIAIEPEVNPWDLAALQVIVEEAGGRFTDIAGTPRIDGGSAVSTNGVLHDAVLAALRQPA